MIFLIDENLSPRLANLHQSPHSGLHVNQLKPSKNSIIKDDLIRKLSLDHPFALVTKDDDFVKSWVNRKVPEKVIFVYDDFESVDQLIHLYQKQIPLIEYHIIQVDFIEFSSKGIRMPFD